MDSTISPLTRAASRLWSSATSASVTMEVLGSLSRRCDREAGRLGPVHHVGDKRGLVAVGHGVHDPALHPGSPPTRKCGSGRLLLRLSRRETQPHLHVRQAIHWTSARSLS